jgi:hypothetical protein
VSENGDAVTGPTARMTGPTDDGPLLLLGRCLPPSFERHVRVLPPAYSQPVVPATWADSLVEVARGAIELEFASGDRVTFSAGDVLWLQGLPLRFLRNPANRPAVLVAVRRRAR